MIKRWFKIWHEKGFMELNGPGLRVGTGVTDSNGRMIYEGDIIQGEYTRLTTQKEELHGLIGGTVVLRNGQFQICGNPRIFEETGTFIGSKLLTKLTILGEQSEEYYSMMDEEDETSKIMKSILYGENKGQ